LALPILRLPPSRFSRVLPVEKVILANFGLFRFLISGKLKLGFEILCLA